MTTHAMPYRIDGHGKTIAHVRPIVGRRDFEPVTANWPPAMGFWIFMAAQTVATFLFVAYVYFS
jgi:hypothetical protein